ncbi:MAG: laminin G domain-containing protein [Ferruginibacter sp.]|nr:laminin G domain-containing protein [Ferruginibacter sp.]
MKKLLLIFFVVLSISSQAQLTGTKTIPGDYATITAAVAALNSSGVGAGGVTFNIAAGYTETGNNTITATGTAANPIIFQKSGVGTNPTITAGVGTGWDGIFKMVGTDYITFDGLTLQENPANSTGNYIQKTEFGFAFFKVDATNGCQHNTIKNCTISLDRLFYQVDPGGLAHYSSAIYMYNVDAGYNWINSESTATGTHSYNIIQNNAISNVEQGVFIYGYHNTSSSIAVIERHNEVKDNSITNFGGNSVARGIGLFYAANCTISGNTISTHTAHQAGAVAIDYNPTGKSGCLITNNTIQLDGNAVTGIQKGIQITGGGGPMVADPLWKTITITNNTILPSNTNYDYTGIYCLYGGAEFEIIENNIINLSSNASTNSGEAHGINVGNWWADATTLSIKNNIVQGHASTITNCFGIYANDNTDLITIENNKVLNNNSANYNGIYIGGSEGSVAKNNIVASATSNTHSYFIGLQTAQGGTQIINNYIGCRANYSASAIAYGINLGAGATTLTTKVFHNTVYIDGNPSSVNITAALNINSTQNVDIRNNIFCNAMLAGTFGSNDITAFANGLSTSASTFMARNNLFYAGTPSATNFIYKSTNGEFQTLENYKMHVCSKDINSVSEVVPFLSLDYTNPNYLHINPAVASLVNNMGFATLEVTVDYDGDARNATTPDIGADELNGIAGVLTTPLTPPVLWLKADIGVFSDAGVTAATNGQTVQQWNDQSCNGYNASQPDAIKRPTWQQYAFNGKPALWFDGTNGNYWLENTVNTPVATTGSARTYFVVAKAACSATGTYYPGGHLFTNRRTSCASTLEFVQNGGSGIFHGGNLCSNHPQATSVNFADGQNRPFIGSWRTNGTGTNLDFWFNGTAATTANANFIDDNGSAGYCIGDRRDGFQYDVPTGRYDWQGHIAEIIVYDRALTEGERQSVETYLQNKYAVTGLPSQFDGVPTTTSSANNNQSDASWVHTYGTLNTKVAVSVNANCANLGTINSTVYVDATAGIANGNRYMRRHYVINPTTDPVGTKRVRLYYTNADFADLQTYIPTLTSASQLVITKFDGTNEDGVYNPSEGTSVLIPSSQITTGTVFGVNYLEFNVTGFSEFWIHTGTSLLNPPTSCTETFNGTTDYVTVGDIGARPTEGSIAFWFKPSALNSYPNILSTGGNYDGDPTGNRTIRFEESGASFYTVIGSDAALGTTGFTILNFTNSLMANNWYHVVLNWNSNTNTVTGFLNGTQVFSSSCTTWPTNFNNLNIGRGFDGARKWNGSLDEINIWNKQLNTTEINNLVSGIINTSDAALRAYYNFEGITTDGAGVAVLNKSATTAGSYNGVTVGTNCTPKNSCSVVNCDAKLWLKADAAVYTDAGVTLATNGQTVQQWNDQTTNAYNVTQSNNAWKPTWDQNAFNGKPAINFNRNVNFSFLENTLNNPVPSGAARTIFIVAKKTCWPWNGGTLFTQRRSQPYAAFYAYNLGSNPITLYSDGVNAFSNASTTVNASVGTQLSENTFVATYKVSTQNGNLQFYVNGVQQTVDQSAGVTNETGSNGFTIATWGAGSDPLPFSGWIAEIIVYDRALLDIERQSVESYLQTKYITTALPAVFSNIPTATVSSNNNQADANWKHTYNSTDNSKVIVSIKDNCFELGTINSTVYVDATAGTYAGRRYMRRHYVINPTADPVGTKRVRLYYTNADFADLQTYIPALTSASQLVITKFDGTNEDGVYNPAEGTSVLIPSSQITTGTVFGVNYLEFDVTGFSEFWIHTGNVALPLQFLSFTAQKCNTNQVCLTWKTANEQNVSHFEIERSIDGVSFSKVGTKSANNLSQNTYTANDDIAALQASKKIYYRIKQVDNNGRSKQSNITWIQLDSKSVLVYPTLVLSCFTVQNNSNATVQLQLVAVDGSVVLQQAITTGANIVETEKLHAGMYMYRIINADKTLATSGKIVRQ